MSLLPSKLNRVIVILVLVVTAVTAGLIIRSGVSAQKAVSQTNGTDGGDEQNQPRYSGDLYAAQPAAPLGGTPCVAGFADIYPCDNVDLMAFMPLADIGGGSGNDIWGWTDPMNGNEYALMGRSSGTSFVDITDPLNPVYLGNLPSHNGTSSSWRDIKVFADHAYIVSEAGGHGLQIFDLTELGSVITPPVTFSETAHYAGFGSAHNIVINEDSGYAYAVGAATCSGGLDMIDISTPISPTAAGCFSADGYTHDAQCIIYNGPDTTYQGREICLNSNEDTLTIVDVEDKSNPAQLSRTGYTGSAYTHQGWITEDHTHFLLSDELDESGNGVNTTTYIWDITDLDNPVNIGNYVADNTSSDHNLYIVGNLAYESNYRSGLRILDISEAPTANLEEIAYFDVYPEDDNAGAGGFGTWSNYPYFDSGNVIVSSIDRGLYIVKPTLASDFNIFATPTQQSICTPADAVYDVAITQIENYTDTVTFNANGVPAGASSDFSDNPVTPPAEVTFTVSNTAAAAVGSYEIDLIGTATTRTHTTTVALALFDTNPGTAVLSDPADAATGVNLAPLFSWNSASQAGTYTLELAGDMDFTVDVYSTTVQITSFQLPFALETSTTYYWRVSTANACGSGGTSEMFSFTTLSAPHIVVSPTEIEEVIMTGETGVTNTITISNEGDQDLSWNAFDLPVGEEQVRIDVGASTGSVLALGVEYVDGIYWVTAGGISSTDQENYLYKLDSTGAVLTSYVQPTVSTWGWRDLAYDGTYLYGSDSAVIEQIDPATGMPTGVTIPGPHNPNRGLAYDPETDHFWVSDQGASIYEIDRDGNIVNAFPNPISGTSTEIYGLAWDHWTAGGPYLWTWSDTPNNNGSVLASQIDPETGLETGLSFPANELDGAAGGATITPEAITGTLSFIGLQQVGSDTVVAYELSRTLGEECSTPVTMPNLSVNPTSGDVPGGSAAGVTISFDAQALADGEYNGLLCITSNDDEQPLVTIPLTYTVGVNIIIEEPIEGEEIISVNGVDAVVPMTVEITNFDMPAEGHWHVLLDGDDLGPVFTYTTSVTVTLGAHTLTAQLQDPSHTPLGPEDSVTITVINQPLQIFLPLISRE